MLGSVEKISYDGEFVRHVELRLPMRGSTEGQLLSIQTCERIGQGSFGTVYRARCDGYPKLALKIATGKTTRLRQELDVLLKVCTKGKLLLPRFEFGAINKAADLIVVGMELCVPSTLHDLLLVTRLTSEGDMLFLAHQVLQAVACVHEQRCIHRDVKLQNFVFDLDGNLKLIDFGLASSVWNPPPGDVVAGTVSFMAPEMAHNALYRDKRISVGAPADVWSVGIVLFSIFTQRNPYPPSNSSLAPPDSDDLDADDDYGGEGHVGGGGAATASATVNRNLNKENVRLLRRVAAGDWRWPVGSSISKQLRELVEFVLVRDPEKRPGILDILNRPIWGSRRRTPPTAVTAFLGVQDDFLFSHDEAPLLRAVEQRSADVTASLMGSRANSPEGDEATDDNQRSSLKFVAKEETSVGGAPTHQFYDIRREARQKKPLREISVVIAEETAKGVRRRQAKRSRDSMCSKSRGQSHTGTQLNSYANSRSTTPMRQCHANEEEEATEEDGEREGGRALKKTKRMNGTSSIPLRGGEERKKKEEIREIELIEEAEIDKKKIERTGLSFGRFRNGTDNPNHCQQPSLVNEEGSDHNEILLKETTAQNVKSATSKEFVQSVRRNGRTKKIINNNLSEIITNFPSANRIKREIVSRGVDDNELIRLVSLESNLRAFVEKAILLELEYCYSAFRLSCEEEESWADMTWLANAQWKSAAHPHRFKETTRVSKKYQYGFVCDMCDYEFLPVGKTIHFFHCTCGRDLCVECYGAFSKQCTCSTCGSTYENCLALREHTRKGSCVRPGTKKNGTVVKEVQRNKPQSSPSKKTTTRTSVAMRGAAATTSNTTIASRSSKASTTTITPPAAAGALKKASPKKNPGNSLKGETVKETTSSSLFIKPINTLPEGGWKPMERLSVSYKPIYPTAEEREVLLNGDWIRHFHLFPTEEEAEPIAFTYHIQPGRTGAIFLNHDFPMHSAVISVLERQMLIVDNVDTLENRDAARVVPLANAKCTAGGAYNLLQGVVAYDCNMMKQHRAPGTISIYRTPQTAVRCHGDPFVYVRWFRCDADRSLSAFLLSNGAVQVLVGDQCELRWFDENRKFLLRSNGVCEMVDEATFALAPDVTRLLYDDL